MTCGPDPTTQRSVQRGMVFLQLIRTQYPRRAAMNRPNIPPSPPSPSPVLGKWCSFQAADLAKTAAGKAGGSRHVSFVHLQPMSNTQNRGRPCEGFRHDFESCNSASAVGGSAPGAAVCFGFLVTQAMDLAKEVGASWTEKPLGSSLMPRQPGTAPPVHAPEPSALSPLALSRHSQNPPESLNLPKLSGALKAMPRLTPITVADLSSSKPEPEAALKAERRESLVLMLFVALHIRSRHRLPMQLNIGPLTDN